MAKTGKGKKLKEGEKLDKNAIMQVTPTSLHPVSQAHCMSLQYVSSVWTSCICITVIMKPFVSRGAEALFLICTASHGSHCGFATPTSSLSIPTASTGLNQLLDVTCSLGVQKVTSCSLREVQYDQNHRKHQQQWEVVYAVI